MSYKIILGLLMAGAVSLSGARSFAADPDPVVKQASVSYSDINLATPSGARDLLERIKSAAREVCGPTPFTSNLGDMSAYNHCRHHAVEQAVKTVNSPWLTAAYEGRPSPVQMAQADIH